MIYRCSEMTDLSLGGDSKTEKSLDSWLVLPSLDNETFYCFQHFLKLFLYLIYNNNKN